MEEYVSDNHKFFGAGVNCQKSFQQWWSLARQSEQPPSPFDFLVNGMGANPKLIKEFCLELMKDSCDNRSEYGPGIVDYMAHHCSKGVERNPKEDKVDDLLVRMVRKQRSRVEPDLPLEQDLLSLAEATSPGYWDCILNYCVAINFSANFLQAIFRMVPSDSLRCLSLQRFPARGAPNRALRKALDLDCILEIQKALPRMKSIEVRFDVWTKQAFRLFVDTMRQTRTLQEVALKVPCYVVDSEETNDVPSDMSEAVGQGNPDFCGIKRFIFGFNDKLANRSDTVAWGFEACTLILESISHMPLLQKLNMTLDYLPSILPTVAPYLVHAISSNPNFQRLSIWGYTRTDNESKFALAAILEALRNNSSIVNFEYSEMLDGVKAPIEEFQTRLYEEKILEILQNNNASLREWTLKQVRCHRSAQDFRSATCQGPTLRSKLTEQIEYYISLNGSGRRKARDPQTDISRFVGLLWPVIDMIQFVDEDEDEDVYSPEESSDRYFAILYGLLRELPGRWSIHALQQYGSASRKRQRDSSSECASKSR